MNLFDLDRELAHMAPGKRLTMDPYYLSRLWPTPPVFQDDGGFAGPLERAADWCEKRGCVIYEQHDPHAYVIQKKPPTEDQLRQVMEELPSWERCASKVDHFFPDPQRYKKD